MLRVLQPNTVPIQKADQDQLEAMGFQADFIQQAYSKCKDKSVPGLLNWLLNNTSDSIDSPKNMDSAEQEDNSERPDGKPKKRGKNGRKHKLSG